jgi:hypothetical protein
LLESHQFETASAPEILRYLFQDPAFEEILRLLDQQEEQNRELEEFDLSAMEGLQAPFNQAASDFLKNWADVIPLLQTNSSEIWSRLADEVALIPEGKIAVRDFFLEYSGRPRFYGELFESRGKIGEQPVFSFDDPATAQAGNLELQRRAS